VASDGRLFPFFCDRQRQAAGGGRWSGTALRGRVGERTGAALAGAAGGAAPARAAAA